jgi:hypothetical protein
MLYIKSNALNKTISISRCLTHVNDSVFDVAKLSYFGKLSNVNLNLPASYNTISLYFCILNFKIFLLLTLSCLPPVNKLHLLLK